MRKLWSLLVLGLLLSLTNHVMAQELGPECRAFISRGAELCANPSPSLDELCAEFPKLARNYQELVKEVAPKDQSKLEAECMLAAGTFDMLLELDGDPRAPSQKLLPPITFGPECQAYFLLVEAFCARVESDPELAPVCEGFRDAVKALQALAAQASALELEATCKNAAEGLQRELAP